MGKINAKSQGVKVSGLVELNKVLKALGPEVQKELKAANFEVGSMVADDARAIAYALGGVAAKVAPSIGATKTATAAGVSFGGAAYPFAGGAEFGSLRYKQFKTWRGNGSDAGYFVYPAIRQDAEEIETTYVDRIDDLMRKHDLR